MSNCNSCACEGYRLHYKASYITIIVLSGSRNCMHSGKESKLPQTIIKTVFIESSCVLS